MQVQVTIPVGGSPVTIHVASLLFDLWEDYLYYREQSELTDRQREPLRYKRHVRAAVLPYFGYLDGLLSSWIPKLEPRTNLKKKNLPAKLEIVEKHALNKIPQVSESDARKLRNKLAHPTPTYPDVAIMEALLSGKFFSDADALTNWLDRASRALGMERLPDVHGTPERFGRALGGPGHNHHHQS